jgi:hypothetical protein
MRLLRRSYVAPRKFEYCIEIAIQLLSEGAYRSNLILKFQITNYKLQIPRKFEIPNPKIRNKGFELLNL